MEKQTVWKYVIHDIDTVRMPRRAKVLCVAMQGKEITLWAQVNPDAALEDRTFVVYGTGHPMATIPQEYLGSVFDGPFVWHIFEAFKDRKVGFGNGEAA